MIQEKQKLSGTLNSKQSLNGSLSNSVIYVDPITQEKTVIPTAEQQIVTPDEEYTGLSKVTVEAIQDENLISENIRNGVDILGVVGNLKEKILGTKNVTSNGIYKASDDELDGYSEVNVETSGVDINDYFKSTIAAATNTQYTNGINAIIKKIPDTITLTGDSCASMFQYCTAITTIPSLDTRGVIDMSKMFFNCHSLQTIPPLNTSEVTNMTSMFENCTSLQAIPAMDTSKVTRFTDIFYSCSTLKSLPLLDMSSAINIHVAFFHTSNLMYSSGFPNLGKAYLTTSAANNYSYTLTLSDCLKLTETSIINVLNNLYDIKTKGCQSQKVVLGSTNLAKLKSEEGQQALASAAEKGWTVS